MFNWTKRFIVFILVERQISVNKYSQFVNKFDILICYFFFVTQM